MKTRSVNKIEAILKSTRRTFLGGLAASLAGGSMSPWLPALAATEGSPKRRCILLWMTGGPSQLDTFDLKPGHANGGTFKPIATSATGLQISEHLPRLAQCGQHLSVLRGLSTREGDHGRGTYLMRTGRSPDGVVRYPTLGSLVSKELADESVAFPGFVSVNPTVDFEPAAYDSGFLGSRYASLVVRPRDPRMVQTQFVELGVDNLRAPSGVAPDHQDMRRALLDRLQTRMLANHPKGAAVTHHGTLQRALQLMGSDAGRVFDLSSEPAEVREKYGPGTFGQGCLLARRLVEQGVSFVEVSLGGWDTHNDNFNTVQRLSAELDAGFASLIEDLRERSLLESTTILWLGEFGRTPQINGGSGRDHFPNAWSAVLAGGGIRAGQAFGRTSADGMTVEDGMLSAADLFATLCAALGIDHKRLNLSDIGRPFRIADGAPAMDVLL